MERLSALRHSNVSQSISGKQLIIVTSAVSVKNEVERGYFAAEIELSV